MYKIIRDAIHGDIRVDDKFMKVIDTKEFQRLRRIKQLSVADMIFPSADHTRFSHSIGTYHVMCLIIEHFKSILKNVDENVFSDDEINQILLAALLHDLGHGPYSHAFEQIADKLGQSKKHEEWTCELINSSETEINKVITSEFGDDMPQKVVDIIKHQQSSKKQINGLIGKLYLSDILSSLISSQLDADRIDYLLRDSFSCGVKFGNIDIQRIIDSLQITVKENRYCVCIPEKFVPDIEAYLLARYQMSKNIYYHNFKMGVEDLVIKIVLRAHDLYKNKKLEVKQDIENLFNNNMSVSDYLHFDDVSFTSLFYEWRNSSDEILKLMCHQFLYRKKNTKTSILNNTDDNIKEFKCELKNIFTRYGYKIDDFNKELFWTECIKKFSAYSIKKENIWVLKTNGVVDDFTKVSNIFTELVSDKRSDKILDNDGRVVYINYSILKYLGIDNYDRLGNEINMLVDEFNVRNNIEIEKKYIVPDNSLFKEIICFFNNSGFGVTEDEKYQKDTYFDTADNFFMGKKITVRLREKQDKTEMTVKLPLPCDGKSAVNERFEYKKEVDNGIDMYFLKEHLQEDILSNIIVENILPTLVVGNSRNSVVAEKGDVKLEIALDSVKYSLPHDEKKTYEEFQVEIELKSSYMHRINLLKISEQLEERFKGKLTAVADSKYVRGLNYFNI